MITRINAKMLASMYKMGYSTFQEYIAPHRQELYALATKRQKNDKHVRSQSYNSKQLKYIVENILGDTPEGYIFNGHKLIPAA